MSESDTSYQEGLDVVVVNYRTPDLLKDFLDSYRFQTSTVPTSLWVIDVAPLPEHRDQVAMMLRDFDEVNYWGMETNVGYSRACNWAAFIADRETIAFFNSDTKLFDDTLDVCYNYLMDHPDTAACGPLQVDSQGSITHAGIFGTNTKPYHRGWRSNSIEQFKDVVDDVVSVSGSAYFVNKAIWDELWQDADYRDMFPNADGAFLPTQHYYEETWFSYFARHRGYKVAYIGSTMMIHEWHKSSPVGSVEGSIMSDSQKMFRAACARVGIECD